MSTDTLPMTAEEYALLPDAGRLTELVRGEVIEMNRPTPRHGRICSKLNRILGNFADEHELGHVVSNDSGILTERNSDTVRGGDVWFISYQKLPAGPLPGKYLAIPPDLVFEVLSPGNSRAKILRKVSEYLAAGISTVCTLDPEKEIAHVFFSRHGRCRPQIRRNADIPRRPSRILGPRSQAV